MVVGWHAVRFDHDDGENGNIPVMVPPEDVAHLNAGRLLVTHWGKSGSVRPAPSCGETGIRLLEERLGLVLPSVFRAYLLAADGCAEPNSQDDNGFRFWPSTEITTVDRFEGGRRASMESKGLVLFADYLDWSWGYAVGALPVTGGRAGVYMIGTADGRPLKIADSFSDFVGLYIADEPGLYG